MVMIIIGFAQTFADMGLGNALIQRQDAQKTHLSSLFWINVATGFLIFVIILLIRPLVVLYFDQPDLSGYLVYSSLIFLIAPFGQIFKTLLHKDLAFGRLAVVDMGEMLVYAAVTISMAVAEQGVLSLIFGQVARSLFETLAVIILYRKIWLPVFYFNLGEIKSYLGFGAFQMGERAVNYLSSNIDYIIIVRFLGPTALGYYTLAYQLMIFPLSRINPVITKVAFPVFSKVQDDNARLSRGYCKAINYIAAVTFPMLIGMFALAPQFITLVYGSNWEPSILILQIFCFVGIAKSLGNPVGSILLAKGRADIGFYWNIFAVAATATAVLIGVRWGINGVAFAILALQIPFFFIIQPITNRLIDLRFGRYFESLRYPFYCSIIMYAVIYVIRTGLYTVSVPGFFVASILGGALVYAAVYYSQDKSIFVELKSMVQGK